MLTTKTAKNSRFLLITIAAVLLFTSGVFYLQYPFVSTPQQQQGQQDQDEAFKSEDLAAEGPIKGEATAVPGKSSSSWVPSLPSALLPAKGPKYAFATFLSTRVANETDDDPYFTATRVLAYQLLHQPSTKSQRGTPFVVIVPPHVSKAKQEVLRQEGATVIPVDLLMPSNWTAHPGETRWIDQFAKLRLFQMTQYDRIAYMDNDMLVTRPLDGIWDEDMVKGPRNTDASLLAEEEGDVPAPPPEYVIAGVTDNEGPGSERPTPIKPSSRLNGGFFVLKPNAQQFDYYKSILENTKPLFDQTFMEMGLLNYAHRSDGPMPWVPLPPGRYCNNWPELVDLKSGSATLHDKFWSDANKGWIDRELVEIWWRTQGRMEGFWQRKDEKGHRRGRRGVWW